MVHLAECLSSVHEGLGWTPCSVKPGMVIYTHNPYMGEMQQEGQEFKAILHYLASLRSDWEIENCLKIKRRR